MWKKNYVTPLQYTHFFTFVVNTVTNKHYPSRRRIRTYDLPYHPTYLLRPNRLSHEEHAYSFAAVLDFIFQWWKNLGI